MLVEGINCSKGFLDFLQEPNAMMEGTQVLEREAQLCDLE